MKVLKIFGGAIVATVVFLIAMWAMLVVVRFFSCGPDSADVKIMKPMAEKISEYIVKHGIPESLKDIPDLPYGLEGCEGKQTYYKFDNKAFANIEVPLKGDAEFKTIDETCYFTNKTRHYYIKLNGNYTFGDSGNLMIKIKNDSSKTGIQYFFKIDKEGNIDIDRKGNPYSSKTDGFCNPMRQ